METEKHMQNDSVCVESEKRYRDAPATSASASAYPAVDKLTITEAEHTEIVAQYADKDRGAAMKAEACGLMAVAESREKSKSSDEDTPPLEVEYVVVDDEEGLKRCLEEIQKTTEKNPLLALDCEGDSLSRIGKLQLVSVATRSKGFLVDIKLLKSQPFDSGLRDIIVNRNIKKLMFDCREDSDALFHQFNVKLEGILDIQLLEIIKQSPGYPEECYGRRRSERHEDVVRLKTLLECIELYTKNQSMIQAKRSHAGKRNDWGVRPLQEMHLKYAMADAMSLFSLYDNLRPEGEDMKRLEVASDVYVNLKRSISSRTFDEFENNGYLPIDVIPPKGKTSFTPGHTNCNKCRRIFPRAEFSNTQVRNGTQQCRICKKVKLDKERMQTMSRSPGRRSRRNELIWYDPSDGSFIYDSDILDTDIDFSY